MKLLTVLLNEPHRLCRVSQRSLPSAHRDLSLVLCELHYWTGLRSGMAANASDEAMIAVQMQMELRDVIDAGTAVRFLLRYVDLGTASGGPRGRWRWLSRQARRRDSLTGEIENTTLFRLYSLLTGYCRR